MSQSPLSRRAMLGTTAAMVVAPAAFAASPRTKFNDADYVFEVQRTEEEWRDLLTEGEYAIMRDGRTERPHSQPEATETREGTYHCSGCDLPLYESKWKVPLDKGWVFFSHAIPSSVMTGIDGPVPEYGQSQMTHGDIALMEVHCRRCGSHLGHFLNVARQNVHCINGLSLDFKPVST